MRLHHLIQPTDAAGAALFLIWQGYHVFSIPRRELTHTPGQLRLFGIGGKRHSSVESFVDCALRESREEIGDVVDGVVSAAETFLLKGDRLQSIVLQETIRPRLIWEKRRHSAHGSMADSTQTYYLVAYDGRLRARPCPQQEVAALLYFRCDHLALLDAKQPPTLQQLINGGVQLDCQPNVAIDPAAWVLPHGTIHLLLRQRP